MLSFMTPPCFARPLEMPSLAAGIPTPKATTKPIAAKATAIIAAFSQPKDSYTVPKAEACPGPWAKANGIKVP